MRRGQVSVETVILFGFITLMLIPASALVYQYLIKSTDDIIQNRAMQIGRGFVDNANLMYNYGDKAKIVVDYNFPDHIVNMSIENSRTLILTIETHSGLLPLVFDMGINVTGYFNESTWSEGYRSFEFKTLPGGGAVSVRMI